MSKKADMLRRQLTTSVTQQNEEASAKFQDKFERADQLIAKEGTTDVRNTPYQEKHSSANESVTSSDQIANLARSLSDDQSEGGLVRWLPLDRVKDHPRNARHIYDPGKVDDMAMTIARDGQRTPVVVMPDPNNPDEYLLIEGRYRKRALLNLGRESIWASIIDPLSDLEAYRLSKLLNDERNEQTTLDNALAWKSMLDDGTYKSQDHIAEHLNIKQGTVSKTLAILDLPAGVLAVIKTSPASFGIRHAQELRQLAKIMPERALESLAEQVKDEKLSVRELEKQRERKEREPVSRERSRAYPLQWGDKELGSVKDFNDGRLKIELAKTPEALRAKIIDAVKKILTESEAPEAP